MTQTVLRLVATSDSTEMRLRSLIAELDASEANTNRIKRELTEQARAYADARGLKMLPRLEQIRRELGL